MGNNEMVVRQLGLSLFEKILLEKEYASKQEVMLNAIKTYKSIKVIDEKTKTLKLAYQYACSQINSLSFEDLKEIISLIKNRKTI